MPKADAEHGAGFAGERADEIAKLAAGLLRNDAAAIRLAIAGLDAQLRAGNSPCSGENIRKRIEPLLKRAFPKVTAARALPKGEAGDLEVVTGHSAVHAHRVEIKAQLEKAAYRDLTQADWIRNDTDALRYLCLMDNAFSKRLSAANRAELVADLDDFKGWSFGQLWLSDVAGLTSHYARVEHSVRTPADLRGFLERKHLLHLCQERDALIPILAIPAIGQAAADATDVEYILKKNAASECAVPILVGGSGPVFTYHIYPKNYKGADGLVGRHKLHGTMLPRR